MAKMEPRWDKCNQRWECSISSGKNRIWFRSKVKGDKGREVCRLKRDNYLHGPKPLMPGSLAEFIESVWWPRVRAKATPATIRGYRSILRGHIARFYGWKLEDIRLEVLQPWVSSIELSPKRVGNVYGVLSSILELAYKTGRYPRHDHKLVVLPEVATAKKPEYAPDTLAKLLEAAKGTELEGPIYAAGGLGLRLGEVCGMKVPHVVLLDGRAVVEVQDNRQREGESSKLKSRRQGEAKRIHVPREVGERLLSYAEPGSLYLFNWNGKPIPSDRVTRHFPAVCRKAGVPRMRFHDLRHLCRSALESAGASQTAIMQILGHSSVRNSIRYQTEAATAQMEAIDKSLGVTLRNG